MQGNFEIFFKVQPQQYAETPNADIFSNIDGTFKK